MKLKRLHTWALVRIWLQTNASSLHTEHGWSTKQTEQGHWTSVTHHTINVGQRGSQKNKKKEKELIQMPQESPELSPLKTFVI